jgi:hypothetical protein
MHSGRVQRPKCALIVISSKFTLRELAVTCVFTATSHRLTISRRRGFAQRGEPVTADTLSNVIPLDWTVTEVAAHVVSLTTRCVPFVKGEGQTFYADMPDMNARELDAFSGLRIRRETNLRTPLRVAVGALVASTKTDTA